MDPSTEIDKNDISEYPVIKSKKNLADQMIQIAQYQAENPSQIQKTAFYGDAAGKKILHINLSNQYFNNCNFQSTTFVNINFNDCVFNNCDFSGASLYKITFDKCNFITCKFSDAKMEDTHANNCLKENCIFTNIQFNNTTGFNNIDENVIKEADDEISETNDEITQINPEKTDIKSANIVKVAISQLKGWQEVQQGVFELNFFGDDNGGIALYSNPEKNQSEENDIWELVLFIGDQSVYMSDYDFFGKKSEEIKTIVSDWRNSLQDSSEQIFKNILTLLKDNE